MENSFVIQAYQQMKREMDQRARNRAKVESSGEK